ncbi:YhcN/YlaJ family sporulation lipoprotein [Margalitia sp. FSL K6-0131]|uniref:YhcN/YlaJ family sporulation lipoprotein n=1 Tax=Margalitia sp. FSL K6-0131 TaxID=2954604 RepID=UPI0030FC2663
MQKICLLIGLLLLLTSCSQRNGVAENNRNNTPQPVSMKNNQNENVDRQTGQVISKRLVQLASNVHGVKDATAVVFGKYAIVGIDVDSNLERSQVGTIKYSVAESLKHDPYGAESIVVADPDINARLKEIAGDIRNGKPGQGIIRELADIAGRLMPEIPKNIIPAKKPDNALEKPKQNLNKQNEKKLENQQEEQSEHKK